VSLSEITSATTSSRMKAQDVAERDDDVTGDVTDDDVTDDDL